MENKPTRFAGGQELSLFDLVQRLANRGWDTQLWYAENGELLDEYTRFCSSIQNIKSRQFQLTHWASLIGDWWKIRLMGEGNRPDLLYANQYFDTPFPALVSKRFDIPLVCHLRLPAPDYLSRQYRWALKQAELLIAISQHTRNTYIQQDIQGDKIAVLPNAIDSHRFRQQDTFMRETPVVSYIGRLCPPKGIELFLDSAVELLNNGVRVQFEIVGKPRGAEVEDPIAYLKSLKDRAGEYLDTSIKFVGHVTDIPQQLAHTDLVVVPSIWAEPFGRVIIESMAAGVPVIATKVGGIPEILQDNFSELLIDKPNVESVVRKVKQHLLVKREDFTYRKKLQAYVKTHYDLDQYIPRLESLLDKVVK
ncbi:MAG: glycosyltransferase family 4 protein [Bacteroidota bacterium]